MKSAIVGSPHGVQAQIVSELPVVSVAETLAGGLGIVDLWYWDDDEIGVALRAAHAALMTAEERDRYERFRFERDRRLFLATRVLVRTVLGRYVSVASADWRFAAGVHGKPYVAHPRLTPPIHFNLANTTGLIACVVSDAASGDAQSPTARSCSSSVRHAAIMIASASSRLTATGASGKSARSCSTGRYSTG